MRHVLERIRATPIISEPFPYFYAENVFPENTYEELLARVPGQSNKKPREMIAFDAGFGSDEFMTGVVDHFNLPHGPIKADTRLVMDGEGYCISPHTDKSTKLISLLFYLPKDNSQEHLGTSIFAPKDPSFRCLGGKYYQFHKFTKLWTAPFRRNSLFGFWKTDQGFHGVERIDHPVERNVILYNVYHA